MLKTKRIIFKKKCFILFFERISFYKRNLKNSKNWLSDGSLGSLHRWRSQRIAKCQSCELQDTMAHFELRITLLTERISHFVAVHFRTLQCAWLSARCFYNTDFVFNFYIYIYINFKLPWIYIYFLICQVCNFIYKFIFLYCNINFIFIFLYKKNKFI